MNILKLFSKNQKMDDTEKNYIDIENISEIKNKIESNRVFAQRLEDIVYYLEYLKKEKETSLLIKNRVIAGEPLEYFRKSITIDFNVINNKIKELIDENIKLGNILKEIDIKLKEINIKELEK